MTDDATKLLRELVEAMSAMDDAAEARDVFNASKRVSDVLPRARTYLTTVQAEAQAVPPREPTEAMIRAAADSRWRPGPEHICSVIWKAMYDAALQQREEGKP